MRGRFVVFGLTLAVAAAAASFIVVPSEPTLAAPAVNASFVIPANDGYGMSECVSSGSSCAKVVADSWCEAQGFARSESIGVADPADVTGSTGLPTARPISITCVQ